MSVDRCRKCDHRFDTDMHTECPACGTDYADVRLEDMSELGREIKLTADLMRQMAKMAAEGREIDPGLIAGHCSVAAALLDRLNPDQ